MVNLTLNRDDFCAMSEVKRSVSLQVVAVVAPVDENGNQSAGMIAQLIVVVFQHCTNSLASYIYT